MSFVNAYFNYLFFIKPSHWCLLFVLSCPSLLWDYGVNPLEYLFLSVVLCVLIFISWSQFCTYWASHITPRLACYFSNSFISHYWIDCLPHFLCLVWLTQIYAKVDYRSPTPNDSHLSLQLFFGIVECEDEYIFRS